MITSGGRYSVTGAALEGSILATIKAWAEENPADIDAFRRQVSRERDRLHRQGGHGHARGMSAEGTQLIKGQVPTKLHHMMRRRVDKNWLWDPEIRNKFWRIFKIGLLNETSEMQR